MLAFLPRRYAFKLGCELEWYRKIFEAMHIFPKSSALKPLQLNRVFRLRALLLLVIAALFAGSGVAQAQNSAPDLPLAERLIRDGRGKQAYDLLAPYQFTQSGRQDFDYLLGLAALESGRPDLATLAFERVIAVNPNHAAAHLDMGRAYFALGDNAGAKAEFEAILLAAPPPAARATAENYLAAIAERNRRRMFALTGYLDVGVGRDSNVNYATSAGSLFVPLFGVNIALAPSSMRQADNFLSYGGGAEAVMPLTGPWSAFAGVDLRQRTYGTAREFNYVSSDFRAGAQYGAGPSQVRVTLGSGQYELDGASFRKIETLGLEWKLRTDERTEVSPFGQHSRIRYVQPASQVNSVNLQILGVGVAREIGEGARKVLFGSIYHGAETATDGRPDGDRSLYGARVGLQTSLRDGLEGFVQASYQKSKYELLNPAFQVKRLDDQYDLTIGVNWKLDRAWSVAPKVAYTRNSSRVPLNEYDRYELSVTLRREF